MGGLTSLKQEDNSTNPFWVSAGMVFFWGCLEGGWAEKPQRVKDLVSREATRSKGSPQAWRKGVLLSTRADGQDVFRHWTPWKDLPAHKCCSGKPTGLLSTCSSVTGLPWYRWATVCLTITYLLKDIWVVSNSWAIMNKLATDASVQAFIWT